MALTRRHLPIALGEVPCAHDEQCRSAAIVLRAHERICRIWGVDAPVKLEARTAPPTYATPEEVAEAVRRASPLLAGIDPAVAARALAPKALSYGPASQPGA
jgi:hypothetical protein